MRIMIELGVALCVDNGFPNTVGVPDGTVNRSRTPLKYPLQLA
jgi:hypothetical protein